MVPPSTAHDCQQTTAAKSTTAIVVPLSWPALQPPSLSFLLELRVLSNTALYPKGFFFLSLHRFSSVNIPLQWIRSRPLMPKDFVVELRPYFRSQLRSVTVAILSFTFRLPGFYLVMCAVGSSLWHDVFSGRSVCPFYILMMQLETTAATNTV